jgi:hypothetical protein
VKKSCIFFRYSRGRPFPLSTKRNKVIVTQIESPLPEFITLVGTDKDLGYVRMRFVLFRDAPESGWYEFYGWEWGGGPALSEKDGEIGFEALTERAVSSDDFQAIGANDLRRSVLMDNAAT